MQTERVTFLTTPDHKAALDAFAARQGKSIGHVVREATSRYMAQPMSDDEEEALRLLTQELNEAVPKMRESLERSITKLEATRKEVDERLRQAGVRK